MRGWEAHILLRTVETHKCITLRIGAHKIPELLVPQVTTNKDDVVASR